MKKSGIYQFINKVNRKRYVGSAVDLKSRCSVHFSLLVRNKHPNKHFQSAWNKYGKENFKFKILEYVSDKRKLIQKEQYWINKFKLISYNIASIAGSQLGFRHSEKTIKLFRRTRKGMNKGRFAWWLKGSHLSLKRRRSISKKLKGRPHTKEHNRKVQKALLGKPFTESRKLAIKRSWIKRRLKNFKHPFLGKHHSWRVKRKISQSLKKFLRNQEK